MSDSYQAIFDATRSKIGSANAGDAIERAAREAFDISHIKPHLQQEIYVVSHAMQRPSVLYRPRLAADGTKWCALFGDDLATSVAGFGDTPAEAMADFDRAWANELTPAAALQARNIANEDRSEEDVANSQFGAGA